VPLSINPEEAPGFTPGKVEGLIFSWIDGHDAIMKKTERSGYLYI